MIDSSSAASSTVRVIGPIASIEWQSGMQPTRGTSPHVGR